MAIRDLVVPKAPPKWRRRISKIESGGSCWRLPQHGHGLSFIIVLLIISAFLAENDVNDVKDAFHDRLSLLTVSSRQTALNFCIAKVYWNGTRQFPARCFSTCFSFQTYLEIPWSLKIRYVWNATFWKVPWKIPCEDFSLSGYDVICKKTYGQN